MDQNGPADTAEGLGVANDIATSLERLDLEDGAPVAWSNDGSELLFERSTGGLLPQESLHVLHADRFRDASERRLRREHRVFTPDGRVVFAAGDGVWVVDYDGGQPDRLATLEADAVAFSPDGTRIAYLVYGDDIAGNVDEDHVWVADVDGTDAREILADEETLFLGVSGLGWSPAGDQLALVGDNQGGGRPSIYTFAADGSDFTKVITGRIDPYWSPDGTRIAFATWCDVQPDGRCPEGSIRRDEYDPQPGEDTAGLAIADADGSNVRAFGFAQSGPWHPGEFTQPDETTPVPAEELSTRVDGEVLSFTGDSRGIHRVPGDLVAVNPETGEERVLVEDLRAVHSARWSADGRWVAYETETVDGEWQLWVVSASQEPRLVATGGNPDSFASIGLYWMWSPTGAELATIVVRC